MIEEDYVSFEIAILLKDKGFNEPTVCVYHKDGTFGRIALNAWNDKFITPICAPTLQMTMKWLREVHNILIVIDYAFNIKTGLFYKLKYPCTSDDYYIKNNGGYKSYKDACEAAIKYCLKNLI